MTAPTGQPGELWWHVHHTILCEHLTEPVENRRTCIREEKPEHERETRLRLLRPVLGDVPPVLARAGAALDRARDVYMRTGTALDRARNACPACQEAHA